MAVVLLAAVGSLAAVMGLFHLPIFTAAWAHDTVAAVTGPGTAVVVRIDTDAPRITRLVDDALPSLPAGAVDPYMPYEAAVGLAREDDTGAMRVVMAASLRRVADIWERLGADSGPLHVPGAVAWQPAVSDAGLWLRTGRLALPGAWQPPAQGGAPAQLPPLPEAHAVAVSLENRGGHAAAVLTPVVWALPLPDTLRLENPEALYALLDGLAYGTATLNFDARDSVQVDGRFEMREEAAGRAWAEALTEIEAGWAPVWATRGVALDLQVDAQDTSLTMRATVRGVRRPLIAWLQGITP